MISASMTNCAVHLRAQRPTDYFAAVRITPDPRSPLRRASSGISLWVPAWSSFPRGVIKCRSTGPAPWRVRRRDCHRYRGSLKTRTPARDGLPLSESRAAQFSLRRRERPSPARPIPRSASVAGSGMVKRESGARALLALARRTRGSCCTSAHATGYDGAHLWCTQHRLVVTSPCPWWERGAGCDEPER